MNELLEFNDINERDEDKSLLNDAKMMDESLVNKLKDRETCKCSWCGIELLKSEAMPIDNVFLCEVCNKKLLEK